MHINLLNVKINYARERLRRLDNYGRDRFLRAAVERELAALLAERDRQARG